VTEKYSQRKIQSSTITTVVSLSLVLFMLGLLALLLLYTGRISNYVKENIGFQVILNDSVKEVDIAKLKKTLDASEYVKSTEEISKEKAAEILRADLGEDFISFLGYNPLHASIDVRLKADFATNEFMAGIEKDMLSRKEVKEVFYQKSMVSAVNENMRKISGVILLFTALLMLIAIALLNNTIRLIIYSKRFLIRTMQLVGATQGFIRKPFILNGIKHGLYGAIIAILLLMGALKFLQDQMSDLISFEDVQVIASLFVMVVLLGIFISWISTSMAVRKYLKMRSDEMYY
jgi:cell division transport system permease protein